VPVKRRHSKRRIDPAHEYAIWAAIFDCGYDFFGELAEIGVPADEHGRPDLEWAAEAWNRHGERYLAETADRERPFWAEREFGRPWERAA
jgi:hypothetical protein